MKKVRSRSKAGAKSGRKRARGTAVMLASMLALSGSASASFTPQERDKAIEKLTPGALKRLLINLRAEDQRAGGAPGRLAQQHSQFVSAPPK